jgi:type I restriction enzyme S subunit
MRDVDNLTPLRDVVELIMGQAPPSKDTNFERQGIPFVKVGEFGPLRPVIREWTINPLRMARTSDVLLCVVGATCGKINLGEDCAIGRSVAAIRPNPAKLDQLYLYYFMMTLVERLRSDSVGAAQTVISKEMVESVNIPLPPLPEQQRIVALLDEAFVGLSTAKANAERNLQNARALFESHLQSVFSERGEGWLDRQLASLCTEITVGHVGSMKTEYKESGIPFLRSQNIRPFEVSMDNSVFIDEAFHRTLKKSQLCPGDLAIVRTGYPGTAAVIPPELSESNCSDLVIVRPGAEVDSHFLAAFFNSAFGKQLVLGKIVGAAQKHFNVTAAKEVVLHVPPLSEQLAIVAKCDEIREETQSLSRIYERKLAALEELKKSLLHQAFNGEL